MKDIAEILEREGGHIIVLSYFLLLCFILMIQYPEIQFIGKASDLILGALLFSMKGNQTKPPTT